MHRSILHNYHYCDCICKSILHVCLRSVPIAVDMKEKTVNYVLVGIREVHKKPVLATAAPLRATAQDLPTATHTPLRATAQDLPTTATHTPLRATAQDLPTATHTPLSTATEGECLPHERPIPKPRASVGDSISHGGMNSSGVAVVKQVPTEHAGGVELPVAMSYAVKSKSTRSVTVLPPDTTTFEQSSLWLLQYVQQSSQHRLVQPPSVGLPRGGGLTPSAQQCQVKSEQATAAPAIPSLPTQLSSAYPPLVAPALQPSSGSGLSGTMLHPPYAGLSSTSTLSAPLGTLSLFGAASTIQHITPAFPNPRVELLPPPVAIDDQSVPQFVPHSMPGSRVLGSVGVSQATTAAAPVQVQPTEVAPPTPIGFKIVNVVVKSSIQ